MLRHRSLGLRFPAPPGRRTGPEQGDGPREGRRVSAAPKRPGYYKGRHFTGYVDEVRSLKRAGRLEEAARLLLKLIKATEAESRATGLATVAMRVHVACLSA